MRCGPDRIIWNNPCAYGKKGVDNKKRSAGLQTFEGFEGVFCLEGVWWGLLSSAVVEHGYPRLERVILVNENMENPQINKHVGGEWSLNSDTAKQWVCTEYFKWQSKTQWDNNKREHAESVNRIQTKRTDPACLICNWKVWLKVLFPQKCPQIIRTKNFGNNKTRRQTKVSEEYLSDSRRRH